MGGQDDRWREEFGYLYGLTFVEYANAVVRYSTEPAPEPLVARLHLVARTPRERVLVCRSVQGWRFLPGGTREPGESLPQLARRELLEEAGAQPLGEVRPFSCFVVDHQGPAPYRPHQPYPRSYWLHAVVDAEVIGEPTSPADGEQITDVLELPPSDAIDYLAAHDGAHAEILRHAIAMGLVGRGSFPGPGST